MPFQSKCADEIPDVSLYDFLIEKIRKGKDDVALIEYHNSGKSITFRELDEYSQSCAGFLHKQGLRKGDYVGVCASVCVGYPVVMLGILACGATVVFCNPAYSKNEILQQFNISNPKMVFVDEEAVDTIKLVQAELCCIEQIFVTMDSSEYTTLGEMIKSEHAKEFPTDVQINPAEDVALLPYSSGTTGLPKAVMVTHRNMVACLTLKKPINPEINDTFYIDRPIYHGGGFGLLFIALTGSVKTVCNKTDKVEDMFQAVEKYKVTEYFTVPSFMVCCAESNITDKYDSSSLKKLAFGGGATEPSIVQGVKRNFNAEIMEVYGSTEASFVSFNTECELYPSSVGTLLSNTEVKIVDLKTGKNLPINESGELLIRSPLVMKGYLNNEEANKNTFTDDGWFRTGDVGYFDKDERLYIVDRIKTRGDNVDIQDILPRSHTPEHDSRKLPWHHNVNLSGTDSLAKAKKELINKAYENMKKSKTFSLTNQQLQVESIRHICYLLGLNFSLRKLEFKNCCVDSTFLETLKENIQEGKVETLNLSRNKSLNYSVIQDLMRKLQCNSLDVSATKFNKKQENKFGELSNVRNLVLNYISFPKNFSAPLTKLLENGLEELSLVDGDITGENFKNINDALHEHKVTSIRLNVLDLSHVKIDKNALEAISEIINKSETYFEKLVLFNCGLNCKSLTSFTSKVKKKIICLDLGLNEDIVNDKMQDIFEVAKKTKAKKLNLTSLSLETRHVEQLTNFPLNISDLDLAENPGVDAVCVGRLVVKWKIQTLHIDECWFSNSDFEAFARSLKGHKLKQLFNVEVSSIGSEQRRENVKHILQEVAQDVVMN